MVKDKNSSPDDPPTDKPRDMNRFCQLLQKALKSRKLGKEKYNLFSKKNLKKNGSRSSEIGPFEILGFVHVH